MPRFRPLFAALIAAASLSAHAIGHLADLSLIDRSTGRELPVYQHEGRAYVVGRPGNEYQIDIRNRSGEDMLGVVAVDGVNVVSGETANTRQGGYVIGSWQQMAIKGWRKSLGETAAFYFTSLGDSYAARTGRPDNVGVIGVALYRRKIEPPPVSVVPFNEPQAQRDSKREKAAEGRADSSEAARHQPPASAAAPSAPLGTGHGRREDSRARYVNFERASEHPAETITIYYDSYRNLVARGILKPQAAPRHPHAFPGFVPDPA